MLNRKDSLTRMSKTAEILSKTFTPQLNEKLIESLIHAYSASADSFMPENGHDGMVYGLMTYKSVVHFLVELSYTESEIEIILRNPRFLMKIGKFLVATYKVGDSLDTDPATAFPNNRVGAYKLAKANMDQMSFDFMEDGAEIEDDSNCTNLILAHAGNAEEGLTQVFLGVPTKFNSQGQITGWGTVYSIWDKGVGDFGTSYANARNSEPKTPVEQVAPPTLSLKSDKKKTANQK